MCFLTFPVTITVMQQLKEFQLEPEKQFYTSTGFEPILFDSCYSSSYEFIFI